MHSWTLALLLMACHDAATSTGGEGFVLPQDQTDGGDGMLGFGSDDGDGGSGGSGETAGSGETGSDGGPGGDGSGGGGSGGSGSGGSGSGGSGSGGSGSGGPGGDDGGSTGDGTGASCWGEEGEFCQCTNGSSGSDSCGPSDVDSPSYCCATNGWPEASGDCSCWTLSCSIDGTFHDSCSCMFGFADPRDEAVTTCSPNGGVCCQLDGLSACVCYYGVSTCNGLGTEVSSCTTANVPCGKYQPMEVSKCN